MPHHEQEDATIEQSNTQMPNIVRVQSGEKPECHSAYEDKARRRDHAYDVQKLGAFHPMRPKVGA